ncbi:uncharacterized protein BCN122_I0637 [Burkholderia cenocepacia]|nr:hypothetical protein [Burkholderia cenocepacia]ARF84024.1 uncharacterized protein BCN122_I0637 [Burkholderia cenocepacia]
MRAASASAGKFRHACRRIAAKARGRPDENMSRSRPDRQRFTETSHRGGILENVSRSACQEREVMRRVSVAVVLCAAVFAACSDDAPPDAHATDAAPQAGASSGAASAFNSDAPANAAASDAAPLAPPVVHYPPDDDDDAKPATNAAASSAAASSPG